MMIGKHRPRLFLLSSLILAVYAAPRALLAETLPKEVAQALMAMADQVLDAEAKPDAVWPQAEQIVAQLPNGRKVTAKSKKGKKRAAQSRRSASKPVATVPNNRSRPLRLKPSATVSPVTLAANAVPSGPLESSAATELMALAEQTLAPAAPLVLSKASMARLTKPWLVQGLPPLYRVPYTKPSQPLPKETNRWPQAILPAPLPRVRRRQLYLGDINQQNNMVPSFSVLLGEDGQTLFGQYLLPLAERSTQWIGFEFTASLSELAFAGEGVFLADVAQAEPVVLTVSGSLSADRLNLSGRYEVVGQPQLKGIFAADYYDFAQREDWFEVLPEAAVEAVAEVEVTAAVEAGPEAELTAAVEAVAEVEVTAAAEAGPEAELTAVVEAVPETVATAAVAIMPENEAVATAKAMPETAQKITIITLPPPAPSLYTEVDFLLAFPRVFGCFESNIYRFQGFAGAAVVGAHAWAEPGQDNPNDLLYFVEEGLLVGSQYGQLLPWYRVQFPS